MHKIIAILALFSMLASGGAPARAADFTAFPTQDKLFVIVAGEIHFGDDEAFVRKVQSHQNVLVLFESPGGSLDAGLKIGRTIRSLGFDTAVAEGESCASACALAWLGGVHRFMGANSRIGFHAAYQRDVYGGTSETGMGNALVGYYLAGLGLSERAVAFMTHAHPDEIAWLTVDDARFLKIEVTLLSPDSRRTMPIPIQPREEQSPLRGSEVIAREFLDRLARSWSGTNEELLTFLSHAYTDRVDFFGEIKTASYILKLKRDYAERWPQRVYSPRQSTVAVRCDDGTNACIVEGIVDWDFRSLERHAHSIGVATIKLQLAISNGAALITSENSAVLARQ